MDYYVNLDAIKEREKGRRDGVPFYLLSLIGDKKCTKEEYVSYYKNMFAQDLQLYYDITGQSKYSFIGCMTRFGKHNIRRLDMKWKSRCHFYMFSISVFYLSLCPQIIGRLYGWKQMENFLRASGWPMMSCGLGGVMHPIQVVFESDLYPQYPFESFYEVLEIVSDYLNKDFLQFFDHNSPNLCRQAYDNLCKEVRVNELEEELYHQVDLYKQWISNPSINFERQYVPITQ